MASTNLGNGFSYSVTVPDTAQHTMRIFVDVSQGIGNLNVSLNDGLTPDYNDSALANLTAVSTGAYTITYQAAATPATLGVAYTMQQGNGSGSTVAADTFNRANQSGLGTASDGQNTWTTTALSGSPAWKIQSNQAVISGATGDTGIALLGTTTLTDGEALCLVQVSNTANGIGVLLRSTSGATAYYLARLSQNRFQLIYRAASGQETLLKSEAVTYLLQTTYQLRVRCVNQTLYARFWPNDGSPEPANWQVTAQDGHLAAGQFGLYGQLASSSDTCTFDGYSAADLTGSILPTAYVGLHAVTVDGTVVPPTTGSISVIPSTPSSPVDLTAEGINDWGKWALSGPSSYDHKSGVTQQIFTYTPLGSGTAGQNTSAVVGYSWEGDGTPDASATNSTTEVSMQGVANGFQLTAAADTSSRTLNVYVTATEAQGQLSVSVSDGSFATYTDASLNDSGTGTAKKYAITYNAAAAGQTLTVAWIMLTDHGGSGGTNTTYDSDTFTRANTTQSATIATGWGSASSGSSWSNQIISGTPLYQISSNVGAISASGSAAIVYTTLGTGTQANVEGLVRITVGSSLATNTLAVVLRKISASTDYRARLSNGNAVVITRRVSSTDTDLATGTYSYAVHTSHWLRFRVDGANLYARAWASGGTEPTAWTITVTDSSPITGAGSYGLRAKVAASDTAAYDSLAFTSTTATSATPPGSIGLGAATLIGNPTSPPPPPPPPPPGSGGALFTVTAADALVTPWMGYGVEVDAYDHATGVPIGMTDTQRALINARLDALNPQIIRTVLGSVSWWCPGGVVGTYNYTSDIMVEWYNVLTYSQNKSIPVVVSLLSPAPFTAISTSWCTAFADLLTQLSTTLSYSCIAAITGLSQPDTLGLTYTQYKTTVEPQLVAALTAAGLSIPLWGPDTTQANDSWGVSAATDLSSSLQGYARQSFPTGMNDIKNDSVEAAMKTLLSSIATNDPTNKVVVQTEMGGGAFGPGSTVALYQYGLEMGDFAIQTTRAGMTAGIAYILDDDMHNTQWGFWKITDAVPSIRPWFFVWNVLTNTIVPRSTLYASAQPASNDMRFLAAQSPQGAWTFVLVNRNPNAQTASIFVPSAPNATTSFQQYVYSSVAPLLVDYNGFPLPSGTVKAVLNRGVNVSMAGSSIMVLTQQSTLATTSYTVPRPPLEKRR